MKSKEQKSGGSRFRFIDFLIVLFCLSITTCGIKLFRDDLYRTIRLQNVQPVGTITIKNNTVQRRIADRVLWDRLRVESPVYLGDIIRVAELSAATLNIEDQQIDIDENTLIRIQLAPDGSGALQIELTEGSLALSSLAYSSLGVTTGADSGGLQLNLMGSVIETGARTALTAAAGKDGIRLQVNEGTAVFVEDNGTSREISSGTMIALDSEGVEQRVPSAVVTQPRANARYVKSSSSPLPIRFAWNRVNLSPQDTLRLEIASDRNFSRDVQSVQNLASFAEVSFEAGIWNWRLLYENTILSGGRLTVVGTSNLSLLSPARGSMFRYRDEPPSLRFQWSEIEEASHYVIEIASSPDFANPRISRQIAAPFFVDSSLSEGTWYWRVNPVFSSAYEGGASFSNVSFFVIEQTYAGEQSATLLEGVQLRELEHSIGIEPPPETVIALVETPPPPPALSPPPAPRQTPAAAPIRAATPPVTQSPPPTVPETPPTTPAPSPVPTQQPSTQPIPLTTPPPEPVIALVETPPPLPLPANREPANNYRIGIEQLKAGRNIVFSWSAVQSANAYIFTLYEQTANGRRQINSVIITSPTWTLENIDVLGRGTFVWQVEAVNRNSGGEIIRRGTPGENAFTTDIPLPSPIQMESPEVLYGY